MSDPDAPNFLDQLLPDRHPQADFFICDVADAVLLEQEWRAWATELPQNPDAPFVGFCNKRFADRGGP